MTADEYTKDKMQQVGAYVDDQLPIGWGFCLVCFPFGFADRCVYVSHGSRNDILRALREYLQKTEKRFTESEKEAIAEAVAEEEAEEKAEPDQNEFLAAFAIRSFAKAIIVLQRKGANEEASELLREASDAGIQIQIAPL